ncbi:unnamed protein product [Spirodela intermedia]|uniref:Uncharacterized protein n=1 Tax=Spirodela intermedia TaxID=51605 RepID=A0A7I8LJM1_SPIIN|nr:unnamed protein product [Spirodela intermedia]
MLSSRPGSPVRSRHCFRIHGFPIRSCCAIVDLSRLVLGPLFLTATKISQYERAITSSIDPELLKSFLEKGGLTNERKMEPEASLKESALPYL